MINGIEVYELHFCLIQQKTSNEVSYLVTPPFFSQRKPLYAVILQVFRYLQLLAGVDISCFMNTN